MQDQNLAAWLSLSMIPGASAKLFYTLLGNNSSPHEFLSAGFSGPGLRIQPGLAESCRKHAGSKHITEKVEQALAWCQQKGCHIFTLSCPQYPALLKTIPDPPPVIYVQGSPDVLDQAQLAMVGSRKPTPGGRALAAQLATELSQANYVICSGMALGIDTESHVGAMQAHGSSIAVLGSGIDRLYPKRNKALAEKLLEQGAIVSEFPLGSAPEAWHFPQRNRIISGLSQGVVVLEAAIRSGSLITARYALEQGREVFAVPGSPYNRMARGCNYLIKNGAKLVEEVDDILEELGGFMAYRQTKQEPEQKPGPDISKAADRLLRFIDTEQASVDILVERSGIATESIMALLVELEINDLVSAGPAGYSLSPP